MDSAVKRIGTTYHIRGMVSNVTSYSDTAGTTAVNQVALLYNSFAQLTSDGPRCSAHFWGHREEGTNTEPFHYAIVRDCEQGLSEWGRVIIQRLHWCI